MRSSGRTAASRTAVRKTVRPRLSLDGERWVNRILEKMALREKLGQLLMVSFHGEFTSSESAEQLELQRAIEELCLGGMMLATRPGPVGIERGQAYATAAVTNLLQKYARTPLLFAADFFIESHRKPRAPSLHRRDARLSAAADL